MGSKLNTIKEIIAKRFKFEGGRASVRYKKDEADFIHGGIQAVMKNYVTANRGDINAAFHEWRKLKKK